MFKAPLILQVIALFLLLHAFKQSNGIPTSPNTLYVANDNMVEGNSNQRNVEVTTILDQPETNVETVSYSSKVGSIVVGSNYVPTSKIVTFYKEEGMIRTVFSDIEDDVCKASQNFAIIPNTTSGISLDKSISKAVVSNNDCVDTSLAEYEVKITHTGYITFSGTLQDCQIRSNGTVVLSGIISGNESVEAVDDIIYTGQLEINIDMNICSTKLDANGEANYVA